MYLVGLGQLSLEWAQYICCWPWCSGAGAMHVALATACRSCWQYSCSYAEAGRSAHCSGSRRSQATCASVLIVTASAFCSLSDLSHWY
jgi:hypothetical protein